MATRKLIPAIDLPGEVWKRCPEHDTDHVMRFGSTEGRIKYRYRKCGKEYLNEPNFSAYKIKLRYRRCYHLQIRFWINGIKKSIDLHKIIADLFCIKRNIFCTQTHHIDGDKLNNKACNLIKVTPSEHQRIHAEMRKGESNLIWQIMAEVDAAPGYHYFYYLIKN